MNIFSPIVFSLSFFIFSNKMKILHRVSDPFPHFLIVDYEYSLWGLAEGSDERLRVKHEVHLRSARKLQELCFKNGGIYIKLGQHIGQLVGFNVFFRYLFRE